MPALLETFDDSLDPRRDQNLHHKFIDILTWVQSAVELTGGQVVHIDGQTARGSRSGLASAMQMVSAWASENQLVLGQLTTENHSNEITAIPELLKLLALKGCMVTIDAMGRQTAIASQIIEQQGDYVLAWKGHHPTLHNAVIELLDQAQATKFAELPHTTHQTVDADHGRIETRRCRATRHLDAIDHSLRAAFGLVMARKIRRSCGTSPSISSNRKNLSKKVSGPNG